MKNTQILLSICLLSAITGFSQTSRDTTAKFNNYGGKVGVGISILDGFGVPVRFYLTPKNVLEAGIYYGGVALVNNNDLEIVSSLMVGAGYTYFGDRFEKVRKQKIRAHGIALRANYLTGDFKTTMLSLGWAMETFKKSHSNRSFIFELGLKEVLPNFDYQGVEYRSGKPTIYLRCHWNFFL